MRAKRGRGEKRSVDRERSGARAWRSARAAMPLSFCQEMHKSISTRQEMEK